MSFQRFIFAFFRYVDIHAAYAAFAAISDCYASALIASCRYERCQVMAASAAAIRQYALITH